MEGGAPTQISHPKAVGLWRASPTVGNPFVPQQPLKRSIFSAIWVLPPANAHEDSMVGASPVFLLRNSSVIPLGLSCYKFRKETATSHVEVPSQEREWQ